MLALTRLPSTIVEVTVLVSPVVTTVPVVSGSVIVRSAVGSVTVSVVSKSSAVAPSKTMSALFIARLPVIAPPVLSTARF